MRWRSIDALGRLVLLLVVVAWAVIASPSFGGENRCDMSYMYPSYADVREIGLASSSHALMRYRDARDVGSTAADASSTCVVVSVFVPGTGGSHRQARSAGSGTRGNVARGGCDVAHYAMDFDEELSAYNAALLARQGESVRMAMRGLRAKRREGETEAAGWVILGHSAGALAGVDAAASDVSAKDDVSVVNLAAPVAWNPVSLTFSMWMYERRARARWVASGARTRVAAVSVVGGARDRQVSSSAMGDVSDWVLEGLAVSANAATASNVGVSTDHRCATWCKQLMDALASGYAKAFPRSKRLTAAERARAFGEALGEPKQNVPARTFGVPNRAYEVTQERSPSALAGVVAAALEPPSLSRAVVFTALAHASSPRVLRARLLESIFASLAVYASTSSIASATRSESARRRLSACCAWFALLPSLIAWFHHAFHTARRRAYGDILHPLGVVDALSALCASSTLLARAANRSSPPLARPGPIPRTIAWCVAACATAPGNVGLVHIAVVLTHLSSVFPVASASAASAKKRL